MSTRNYTYHVLYERIMTIVTRRGATILDACLTRDGIGGKPSVAIYVTEDTAEPYESVTLATYPNLVGGKAIATLHDGNTIYHLPTYQGMMARAAMGGVLPGVNLHTSRASAEEVFDWFNVDAEAQRQLLKPLGGQTNGARHDPVDPLAAAQRTVKAQAQTITELRATRRRLAEQVATLRGRVDQYAPVLADAERIARERKDTIDKHAKTIDDQTYRLANQAKTIIADQAAIDDLNAALRIAEQRDAAHQEELAELRARNQRQGETIDRYQKAYADVIEERDNLRAAENGGLREENTQLHATNRQQAATIDRLRKQRAAVLDSYKERGEMIARSGRDLDRTKDLLARWQHVAALRQERLNEATATAAARKQEIATLTEQRDEAARRNVPFGNILPSWSAYETLGRELAYAKQKADEARDTIESLRGLVDRQAKEHKRLNRHINRIRSAATQLRHSVADGYIMYPVLALLNTIDTEEGES